MIGGAEGLEERVIGFEVESLCGALRLSLQHASH